MVEDRSCLVQPHPVRLHVRMCLVDRNPVFGKEGEMEDNVVRTAVRDADTCNHTCDYFATSNLVEKPLGQNVNFPML